MDYLQNQEIIKHCPNFYKIKDCDIYENDVVLAKLIKFYENYIFTIDLMNLEEVNKIEKLDKAINEYIDNLIFRDAFAVAAKLHKPKLAKDKATTVLNLILEISEDCQNHWYKYVKLARWI